MANLEQRWHVPDVVAQRTRAFFRDFGSAHHGGSIHGERRFLRGRQAANLAEQQLGGVIGSKNVDLAPDGKRIAALMPVETAEGQKTQNHAIFLENFFDEVRRRTATLSK